MNDIYVMNKETGELVPCEQVIREFYKDHGILESIFDYWNEFGKQFNNHSPVPVRGNTGKKEGLR